MMMTMTTMMMMTMMMMTMTTTMPFISFAIECAPLCLRQPRARVRAAARRATVRAGTSARAHRGRRDAALVRDVNGAH
jgi:hypothetical protein